MDLSNRQSAEYWHKRAEEVTDRDLRKEALAAHRKFRNLALREERLRLRREKPGYGVRSMFGWIVFVALIVLGVILGFSKVFSVEMVCGVFVLAITLSVIAAAVTLRVYGHISEDAMLAMIQKGLSSMTPSVPGNGAISGSRDASQIEPSSSATRMPSAAPAISFDDENSSAGNRDDTN